jgi:hypothetical protein
MISELIVLACGMYIGKYHPEYVPIPRIKQEYIDALLAYLKSLQTPAAPAAQTPPTNELKNE